MLSQKHEPEIEGLRNMLCSKGTVAGILVLCDILKPVIDFGDYLQEENVNFSEVKKKLTDLVNELYLLIDRFQVYIHTLDVDLYFSRLQTLFYEIEDRTDLQRRLRHEGVYDAPQTVEEVAVPITQWLINELEDSFHLPPVRAAFDTFNLESVPNKIEDLEDYKKVAIQALASHYGRPRVDVFAGHRVEVNPLFTEDVIQKEFNAFKRNILMLKQRNPLPDLYMELASDPAFRNSYPVMFFLVGLSRIIPSSTASVERVFSLMNSLCTSGRSSMGQATLDALMRICVHNQKHTNLSDREISGIIDSFKQMKPRELNF